VIFPCANLAFERRLITFRVAPEDILSVHRIAVLLALCFGASNPGNFAALTMMGTASDKSATIIDQGSLIWLGF
jgi:hypothetical protein